MNLVSLAKNLKDNHAVYFPWMERFFLCLAVLIVYANVWPNQFVFDDKNIIVWNPFLKNWSGLATLLTSLSNAKYGVPGGFYRPVLMLVYFLVYQAFGASTVAFHALNISLQALNACLLHHFGIRAGFRKGAAFAAALLWAVHPLHTSVVTYMSVTSELLWSCFSLLGLITLLPAFAQRRSGAKQIPGAFAPHKIWKAMIFFMLALGCKESAVVFPALASATLFFVNKDRAQFSVYLKTWPLWLLSACYAAAWLLFTHKSGYSMDVTTGDTVFFRDYTSNFTNRIFTSLATLPVYAGLIVWPAGLHMERVFPVFTTLLAWLPATGMLLAGLGLLQILWGGMRRGLALSFGILWFAAALSPYTGIVIPVDAIIAEDWLYLPTMGLFLGVAQTAAGFFETRQNAARLLVGTLALSLGIATFFQNEVWRNPETLTRNISENGGRVDRLSYNLGLFYMEQGQFDKAAAQFQGEIARLNGRIKWADIHLRLAMALLQVRLDANDGATLDDVIRALPTSPHIPEAISELEKVLQDDPDFYQAHIFLAAIYRYQGNSKMMNFHLQQVKAILKKQRK